MNIYIETIFTVLPNNLDDIATKHPLLRQESQTFHSDAPVFH